MNKHSKSFKDFQKNTTSNRRRQFRVIELAMLSIAILLIVLIASIGDSVVMK